MWRVGITTSAEEFPKYHHALEGEGVHAISLPCISFSPSSTSVLDVARSQVQHASWVVLTSPRTVQVLWPSGGMPPTPALCVGPTTASHCTSAGGTVHTIGTGGAGELIQQVIPLVAGSTVAFPHAEAADPQVTAALAANCTVEASVVYRTELVPPGEDSVDAVIFSSPSAVTSWCEHRALGDIVIAALGTTTAAELDKRGYPASIIPEHPDVLECCTQLAHYLALLNGRT